MRFPNRSSIVLIASAAILVFLAACGPAIAEDVQWWVDVQTKDFVGRQMKQYVETQPPPYYEYSAQRDTLIQLYNATVPELRPAWHVFSTPGVGATDVCTGMGAPIPYGVSLTAPEYQASTVTLDLAEPPGFYTNGVTTEATWVLCDFGNGLEPVYSEDIVRTYFHPVSIKDGMIVHEKGAPSFVIETKAP